MEYKTKKNKNQFEIEIFLSSEEWEKEVEAAYKKGASKYNVQGFRKGKAPRKVIEKNYGADVFIEDALNFAFICEYNKILKEKPEIRPVDYPILKSFNAENDGMKITAVVDVEPEFTLGKYTGLEVKKVKHTVTEQDVDAFLNEQAQQRARLIATDKEHKLAVGDTAVIDFVGSVDGVEFEGGAGKGHELEIGSHSFIDNFEDQLVGHKVDDEVIVNVKFPEQYHADNLAGKPAKFVVNIKNVLRKEVPALDDQFAKEVSEFENLTDYKKSIKERLEKEAVEKAEKDNQNNLLKTVVEATKIEVPERMVEIQLDHIMHDLEHRLGYQGISLEMYASYMGISIEDLREKQRETAVTSVSSRLVFDAIMEKEKITVSTEELDEEIEKISKTSGKKASDFKDKRQMEFLEQNMKLDKLFKFLIENNKLI